MGGRVGSLARSQMQPLKDASAQWIAVMCSITRIQLMTAAPGHEEEGEVTAPALCGILLLTCYCA